MAQLQRLLLSVVLLVLPIIAFSGTSSKKGIEPDVFGTDKDYSLNNFVKNAKLKSDDTSVANTSFTPTITRDMGVLNTAPKKHINTKSVTSYNLTGKWFGTFKSNSSGNGYGFEATLSSSGNHFNGKTVDQTDGNPEGLINSGVVSEDGIVSFTKQYMDTDVEQVKYAGHFKSDGSIIGTWHTKSDSGTFNMSLDQ